VIERAVLLADGERIEVSDVDVADAPGPRVRGGGPVARLSMRDAERSLVLAALARAGFVQKDAAQLLASAAASSTTWAAHGHHHPSWRRNRTPREDEQEGNPRGRLKTKAPSINRRLSSPDGRRETP